MTLGVVRGHRRLRRAAAGDHRHARRAACGAAGKQPRHGRRRVPPSRARRARRRRSGARRHADDRRRAAAAQLRLAASSVDPGFEPAQHADVADEPADRASARRTSARVLPRVPRPHEGAARRRQRRRHQPAAARQHRPDDVDRRRGTPHAGRRMARSAVPALVGDYFQTMGIPVLRGRIFNDGDGADGAAGVHRQSGAGRARCSRARIRSASRFATARPGRRGPIIGAGRRRQARRARRRAAAGDVCEHLPGIDDLARTS